jgi:polysaccharide deacetylase family protein (PEP-CTERM system associated)
MIDEVSNRSGAGAPHLSPRPGRVVNAMSVDVEDYFQVEALAEYFPRQRWDEVACRVEGNVDRLLALFEAAGVRATFFMLGWIAERYPAMIRRIVAGGHEIASHGCAHVRADRQQRDEFKEDIRKSKQLLEDLAGSPVSGYRAPSFSIGRSNLWAFEALESEGYAYSSSVYPIRHDLYGLPEAPRFPFHPGGGRLLEIPMTTTVRFRCNLPCAGGGYFRLLPYALSRANLRRVNAVDGRPCVFYCHPWEIDPEQPRQSGISWRTRVRHYVNLTRMETRLKRLLADFDWSRIDHVFFADNSQDAAPRIRFH